MALTTKDKIDIRRAIGDFGTAEEIIGIIDGGSSTTLSARAEHALRNAIAEHRLGDIVVDAVESGSAVSGIAVEAVRRAMGSKKHGDNVVTELNAIT